MPGRQIGVRLVPVAFTVAAGTPQATPSTQTVLLPGVTLESVQVEIPSGHNGQTGLQIFNAGTVIVPWGDAAQWLVGSDRLLNVPVELDVDSVQLRGYNVGHYPHTFYLRFVTITSGGELAQAATPITLVEI